MRYQLIICAFVLALANTSTHAEDCSKALVLSKAEFSDTEVVNIALALSLSEDAFKKAQRTAGASAVIYGVPAKGSYSEYREAAVKKAQQLKIDNFQFRAIMFATSGLSQNSLNAYKSCLLLNNSPDVVVERMTSTTYIVSILFNPLGSPQLAWAIDVPNKNISDDNLRELRAKVADIPMGKKVDRQIPIVPADPSKELTLEIKLSTEWSRVIDLPPLVASEPNRGASIPLTRQIYNGTPAIVIYDDTACKKHNLGTLLCNFAYNVQYNKSRNKWSVYGFNLGTKGKGNWDYYNSPPQPGNISMWGHLNTFDDDGALFERGERVGTVQIP